MKRAFAILLAAIVLVPAIATAAAGQEPPWNRRAEFLSILPDAGNPGMHEVRLAWFLEVNNVSSPVDLSTRAELRINGATVSSSDITEIVVEFGGGCTGVYPWCASACGSIGWAALHCHNSCMGPSPCHCACGYWLVSNMPTWEPLVPGDEITVILYPGPGARPDSDTSDDAATVVYRGGPIFWDRTVERIHLIPAPGQPDTYDVQASGKIAFDGMPDRWMDLSFQAILLINGTPVDSHLVQAEVQQADDITCFQLGCGNYCGTHNGIQKDCAGHFLGCACGGDWILWFPGIGGIGDNDVLTVQILVANSGVPELILHNDIVRLMGTSDVDGAAPVSRNELAQNRPNPLSLGGAFSSTEIVLGLAESGPVRLELTDVTGRVVRTLAREVLPAGQHRVQWDGRDDQGRRVPAGVYFYRLHQKDEVLSRKLLVVD